MDKNQEFVEIEVELDSDLLYKVNVIAGTQGMTAEEYISNLIRQYVTSHQ